MAHATMSPVNQSPLTANARVQLHILGEFDLRVDGAALAGSINHSAKLRNLLCYFILHRHRAIPQAELIETFYEDENQSNPAAALKMQVMRLRNLLAPMLPEGVASIIGRRGSYQWNPELPCWVDVHEFEGLCQDATREGASGAEVIDLYRQAIALYRGDPVLEKDNYLWSRVLVSHCHSLYLSAVEHYAQLMYAAGQYAGIEETCLKAIGLDLTNEALYIILIRALLKEKKFAEARAHYVNIVDALHRELGVRPSAELQQLYNLCTEEEMPWEQDLSVILAAMRDPLDKRLAFLCGFEQFKNIYQLEMRRALRSGGCLHVALLTVFGRNDKPLAAQANNTVMESVQQVIIQNLRQSDVVARYSSCQFIIMLPNANEEDSNMVMNRIIKAYQAFNPRNALKFSFQIRALE